jgi:hypothetical protein
LQSCSWSVGQGDGSLPAGEASRERMGRIRKNPPAEPSAGREVVVIRQNRPRTGTAGGEVVSEAKDLPK